MIGLKNKKIALLAICTALIAMLFCFAASAAGVLNGIAGTVTDRTGDTTVKNDGIITDDRNDPDGGFESSDGIITDESEHDTTVTTDRNNGTVTDKMDDIIDDDDGSSIIGIIVAIVIAIAVIILIIALIPKHKDTKH